MIHRGLIADKIGKQIVGVSVVCLLILIVSGIVIYWDRLKKSFIKSITFSFKSKNRKLLSTMHSSVGMWIIPFLLLASITGLTWSYPYFKENLFTLLGVEKTIKKRFKQDISNTSSFNDIQTAIYLFKKNISNYDNARISLIENKNDIYTLRYIKNNPIHNRARNSISIDIKNQTVLKHEQFSTLPFNKQLTKSIYPLHTGEYFGVIGQTLMFLSSLALGLLCVTGVWMYIKRKF